MNAPKYRPNSFRPLLVLLTILLLLAACVPDAPQTIPTPTQTSAPTRLPPTATLSASPTPTALPPCSFNNDFLLTLKENISSYEATLIYNIISEERTLLVWYVDPDIDPDTPEEDFQQALTAARMRAAALANTLNQADPCVAQLVDIVNIIVVDANYTGWYSGQIFPDQLPGTDTPNEEQLRLTMARFQSSYLLDTIPKIEEAPDHACPFRDINRILFHSFKPEQENIGFYYVVDSNGVNMWAQWVGSTDAEEIYNNLRTILNEIDCLYPPPSNLITIAVAPQTGEMVSLSMLSDYGDGLILDNYQTLFTQE